MPNIFSSKFLILLFLIIFVFLPLKEVFASATNGTISGYAWSDKIGWINFGTANGNTHITASVATGYAWNENVGWINLNPANGGVYNNGDGSLLGKAWSEGTGWINFSGVRVSNLGIFSGTATGDNGVNITFDCANCNVATDWRPYLSFSGGGGGGGASTPVIRGSILINNGVPYTNNRVVNLTLNSDSDVSRMMISNFSDFQNGVGENFSADKIWTLNSGDGPKTVYVRFYNKNSQPSEVFSSSIILDTAPPEIKITSIKNNYDSNEEVIISGITENNAKITLLIDNNYGLFSADQNGNWFITLGKMSLGKHRLELTAEDMANNTGKTVVADFSVIIGVTEINPLSPFTLAPPLAPIFRQFAEGINSLLPKFFKPVAKNTPTPTAVVTVPKNTPFAFRGNFHYISTKPLAIFVLSPLPSDIKLLAQKFPQVQKTFNRVGIQKITDVQKLTNANLKLPNLTESVLSETELATGKLFALKGIPIEKLSILDKGKIPSEFVFAKAGGGLIDFNIALSLNNKGQAEQTIQTVVGYPIQLVVRVDKPVKRVIGYVVFKSKKYNQVSYQAPLRNMTSSLLFANPALTAAVSPSISIGVEGNKNNYSELEINVIPQESNLQTNPTNIERRLVLATFEYQDSGNGLYTATVQAPVVDAKYEIITVIDYRDINIESKEIKLITVVDPEGYVYEKNGDLETRIAGAVVSLYWLNPNTKQYELWPAKDFQQEDPQTTDVRGTYSFLVPNGYYYLKVDAPGYLSYDGKPFEVKEGSGVHINIELKTKYWFLKIVDWKTLLLIIVILLLVYNFYKDRKRERIMN